MHKYTITLSKDRPYQELYFWTEAEDWFKAEKHFKDVYIPGWHKGMHQFVDNHNPIPPEAKHISEFKSEIYK